MFTELALMTQGGLNRLRTCTQLVPDLLLSAATLVTTIRPSNPEKSRFPEVGSRSLSYLYDSPPHQANTPKLIQEVLEYSTISINGYLFLRPVQHAKGSAENYGGSRLLIS